MKSDGRLNNLNEKSGNRKGTTQSTEHKEKRVLSRRKGAGYNQPRGYINGRNVFIKI